MMPLLIDAARAHVSEGEIVHALQEVWGGQRAPGVLMAAAAGDRRIRVVVAKPGLDGHDRGAKIIARALRDAGMEVIYTGLHQTPEQIVETTVIQKTPTQLACRSSQRLDVVGWNGAADGDEHVVDVLFVQQCDDARQERHVRTWSLSLTDPAVTNLSRTGEDNDHRIINPLLITQAGGGGGGIAMMSEQPKYSFAKLFGEDFELAVSGRMRHDCALFEELSFVRREAQAEANLAYEAWRRSPRLEAYAVYRAAQDQADAAQDDLAHCWLQLAA